ncbi:hypothetical protein M501DRAFT_673294 [Patellaria atrata CBS 101060]|uniref:Uncharacterized protein n=1 Tax=Patellaria atrata CBS 101060 TaxID=1346257 RepID=A0A9P4VTY1_9PEZI|nr:hypothetical protein M501DRAFT_673294 [Patellaria atrata CBS 101060]
MRVEHWNYNERTCQQLNMLCLAETSWRNWEFGNRHNVDQLSKNSGIKTRAVPDASRIRGARK